MEYRDLYDDNKKVTGEIIKKGDSVPKERYYLTVIVWIQNQEKDFLLQINKKYNMWATTGGHLKSGETSLEGIVTEIKEELGLVVKKEELKLFQTIKTDDDFVDLYYLKQNIDLNKIIAQEEEVGNIQWYSVEEIIKLIKNNCFLPSHIEFFDYCMKYLEEKNINS